MDLGDANAATLSPDDASDVITPCLFTTSEIADRNTAGITRSRPG